jgi:hypothetical protein
MTMFYRSSRLSGPSVWITAGAATVAAAVIYYLTAFRTITWWDNSEYAAAAATLGIVHPPGSLIATLIGWVATKLSPLASNIFTLNLLASLLAAITTGVACALAIRAMTAMNLSGNAKSVHGARSLVLSAALAGALGLAFGETMWTYAVKFTPYVFTALFTVLILWAMLRWWQEAERDDALGWLVIIAVLFGLDFSVHRTNLLLLPGLLIWVLLRRPQVLRCGKCWLYGLYGLSGFVAALALQFLIIPIAASHPSMNAGDPSSWSRFWSYITLQQFGGGWLFNIFPRKGAFFGSQVMDYLNVFASNFFTASGKLGVLGTVPALLGLIGLVTLWRRNVKLAVGFLVLFLLSSMGAIIYFNVPAGFFRSMDRHYLPSLIIFAVWVMCGAMALIGSVRNFSSSYRTLATALVMVAVLSVPIGQLWSNYRVMDSSKNFFTENFAKNVLANLPQNSILLTAGDNDTFPLWCLQMVQGMRPDVSVVNIGLLNTSWYMKQQAHGNPGLPLNLTDDEIDSVVMRPWTDSTIFFSLSAAPREFGLPETIALPDSIGIKVAPTVADKYILAHDLVLISMLQQNRWRRPIYLMSTTPPDMVPWLRPYLQLEGYASRVVPITLSPLNAQVLEENLINRFAYAGYADPGVPLDLVSRQMAWNLYGAFLQLADASRQNGDLQKCSDLRSKMLEFLPPPRLQPPPQIQVGISSVCGGTVGSKAN